MGKRAAIAAVFALWIGVVLAQAPTVTATWTGPNTASVSWSGGELWLLSRGRETWIKGPSPQTLDFGQDSAYAPRAGDIYEVRSVTTGGELARVVLGPEPKWYTMRLVLVVH